MVRKAGRHAYGKVAACDGLHIHRGGRGVVLDECGDDGGPGFLKHPIRAEAAG